MISIEEMEVMLNELAGEFPQEFFRELNGGIILKPEVKFHEENLANDLYVLGTYHRGGNLGRYIAIYYGSFSKIYGKLSKDKLKKKLKKTLKHEFLHHLEFLAGERDLEIEDAQNIANYKKRYRQKKKDSR